MPHVCQVIGEVTIPSSPVLEALKHWRNERDSMMKSDANASHPKPAPTAGRQRVESYILH